MLREHRTANRMTRWTIASALALVVLGGFASAAHGEEGSLDQRRAHLQVPSAPHGGVQAPGSGPHGGDIMPLPTTPPKAPAPRIPPAWTPPTGDSTDATNSNPGALWLRLFGWICGRN